MNSNSRTGGVGRPLMLIAGCAVAAAVAGPSLSVAAQKVTDVVVKNTAAEPVPTKAQGTTEVTGGVTVENAADSPVPVSVTNPSGEPAAPPQPFQKRFVESISHDSPGTSFTIYEVPEGKVLTVEHGQIFYAEQFGGPAPLRSASFSASCAGAEPIGNATYNLAEIGDDGSQWRTTGGELKLHVAGGGCLRGNLSVDGSGIPENVTLGVNGSVSGYLTDAP